MNRAEFKTRHMSRLKHHIFMRISMKYCKTKIVFNKNPVENTGHHLLLKQYYTRCDGEETFFIFHFFIIPLCNDTCCHCILSPQCIRAGYFA